MKDRQDKLGLPEISDLSIKTIKGKPLPTTPLALQRYKLKKCKRDEKNLLTA